MAPTPIVPGDVVRRSVDILRAQFALLYPIALVFGLIQAMASYALLDTGAAALALALSIVLNTLMVGIVVVAVHEAETGKTPAEPTVGPLLRTVAPLADKLLLVLLITLIGVIGGLFLLIIPGLFLMVIWAVAAPVVVLERAGPLTALTRSRDLVVPSWRSVALTLLLTIAVLLPAALAALGTTALGSVGGSFVQVLVGALVTVLSGIVATLLYLRLVAAEAERPAPSVGGGATDLDPWEGDAGPDDDPGADGVRVRPEDRTDEDAAVAWGGGSRTGGRPGAEDGAPGVPETGNGPGPDDAHDPLDLPGREDALDRADDASDRAERAQARGTSARPDAQRSIEDMSG